MKREKYIALLSFVFCVCLVAGLSIACGSSQSLTKEEKKAAEERKKATEERKKAAAKHKEIYNSVVQEMISKYPDIFDLEGPGKELFVMAYNNPEENPNIANSTEKSQNEFQYMKFKETYYKPYRSKKYAVIETRIDADKLQYDFNKNQFRITLDRTSLKSELVVADFVFKNGKNVIFSINPDDAAKLKSGITYYYDELGILGKEDIVTIYIVVKINGKITEKVQQYIGRWVTLQHISADIIDYSIFWFVDAGISEGHYSPPCGDRFECATDIKVFRKP